MAPDERAKLERVTGGRGAERLLDSIAASTVTWAGLDDDGVVTLGGVRPHEAGGGYFWQVVTPALPLHKRAYIRQGHAAVAAGLEHYQRLATCIEASYGAALRHARRLGFAVGAPSDVGGTMACRCLVERSSASSEERESRC